MENFKDGEIIIYRKSLVQAQKASDDYNCKNCLSYDTHHGCCSPVKLGKCTNDNKKHHVTIVSLRRFPIIL